jgi:signal peptidase II
MAEGKQLIAKRPDRPLSFVGLSVIGLTIAIDQIAKMIVERTLPFEVPIDLLPILSLYRVYNTGIAFSLLSGFGDLGLIVLTLAITVVVIVFWQRSEEGGRWAAIGYALIIGGALGNLIDRIAYGHVVDFLYLHLGDRSLFVFNLADAALTLGPCLLILAYLLPAKPPPPRPG